VENQAGPESRSYVRAVKYANRRFRWCLRGMPLLSRSPSTHPIIGSYKVPFHQHGVVAVGYAPDHLPIDVGSPVPASAVRTQRVRERAGGRGEEGRREGARRPFGE